MPPEFTVGKASLLHIPNAFQFALFPASGALFAEAQIQRSTLGDTLIFGPASVISPEDILPAKLHWFHLGCETSEQQWKDMTALLAIQGSNLDRQYLNRLSLLP